MDLSNLTEDQLETLDELVHDVASRIGSNVVNSGDQIEWLLAQGLSREEIERELGASQPNREEVLTQKVDADQAFAWIVWTVVRGEVQYTEANNETLTLADYVADVRNTLERILENDGYDHLVTVAEAMREGGSDAFQQTFWKQKFVRLFTDVAACEAPPGTQIDDVLEEFQQTYNEATGYPGQEEDRAAWPTD